MRSYVLQSYAAVRKVQNLLCTDPRSLNVRVPLCQASVYIRVPCSGAETNHQKSVAKNSIIKRDRFEAPPPRHMMCERHRTSADEKEYAPAARDRARSARWSGRDADIGQTAQPFRASSIYIAGFSSLANARSKYTVPASRPPRNPALWRTAFRCAVLFDCHLFKCIPK